MFHGDLQNSLHRHRQQKEADKLEHLKTVALRVGHSFEPPG